MMSDLDRGREGVSLPPPPPEPPSWVPIAGVIFGAVTLVFLGALVVMASFGLTVPPAGRFAFSAFFALGAGLSTGFLGANAALKGHIPIPFAKDHALQIAAGGGVAVLIIIFLLSA